MVNSANKHGRRLEQPVPSLVRKPSPITIGLGDSSNGGSIRAGEILPNGQSVSIPVLRVNPEFKDVNIKAVRPTTVDAFAAKHSSESFDTEMPKTVTWDIVKATSALAVIRKKKCLDGVLKEFPEAYIASKLMLERLTFQMEVYKVKSITPLDMVAYSFQYGPEFAGLWKSARESQRLKWLGVKTWREPDENPFTSMIDYSLGENGVYHQRFFIFWDEECNDYEYSLEDRNPEENETIDDLRESAKALSDRYLKPEDFGDEIDLMLEAMPVSSSCFLEGHSTKKKEWESEFYDLYSLEEEPNLRGVRSKAPKRPGETRDITIPAPGVLRRCKRLNRPLKQSIKRVHTCPMGASKERCIEIMEDHDIDDYHYMRDFRKIGLTLPKSVIRAFLEGFFHKYPDFRDLAIEFFCNSSLRVTKEGIDYWVPTLSGFHMGFFNEGLTWIQYCVHSIVMTRIPVERARIKFTAFNDDSLISCKKYKLLDLYQNLDQAIWDDLNCPLSYNKCGMSKHSFIYLEEIYKNGMRMPKDSYFSVGTLGGKYAVNIVHAKEYVNAITASAEDMTIGLVLALEMVITHWGYEFYPEEHKYPFLFGGWITPKEEGLDVSLRSYNGSKYMKNAYHAVTNGCDVKKELRFGKGWTFLAKRAELSLFGEIPKTLDKICGTSLHFTDETTSKKMFTRLSLDVKALSRFYFRSFSRRKKLYEQKTVPDPIEDWFLKHPNSVITPHTVGETVKEGTLMLGDAPSLMSGKPQRLALQVLINEGNIRTSLTQKVKWPKPLQDLLLKGYLNSVPCTKLPEGKYVHETLLYGFTKPYELFYKQNGCFPTSKRATILSDRFLISAEKQVPWQIVDMLKEIKRDEDIILYQNALNPVPPETEDDTAQTQELNTQGEEATTSMSDPSVFTLEFCMQLLLAADPEWNGRLPVTTPVFEAYASNKEAYGYSHSLDQIVQNSLNAAHQSEVSCDTGLVAGLDLSVEPTPGVWDTEDDWGDSMFGLFDED